MFQNIEGHEVFVVDIPDNFLALPITAGWSQVLAPYAIALNQAIAQGLIQKPGKYAIEVLLDQDRWNVFAINE